MFTIGISNEKNRIHQITGLDPTGIQLVVWDQVGGDFIVVFNCNGEWKPGIIENQKLKQVSKDKALNTLPESWLLREVLNEALNLEIGTPQ